MAQTKGLTSNRQTNSTSHNGCRICVRCGARLACDNTGLVCTCHVNRYDPRCDGQWPAKLRAYVSQNVGSTIHPTAHFGIIRRANKSVSREVAKMRTEGWTIESVRGQDRYLIIGLGEQAEAACAIVDGDREIRTKGSETL
jgi:hypothetical protein